MAESQNCVGLDLFHFFAYASQNVGMFATLEQRFSSWVQVDDMGEILGAGEGEIALGRIWGGNQISFIALMFRTMKFRKMFFLHFCIKFYKFI